LKKKVLLVKALILQKLNWLCLLYIGSILLDPVSLAVVSVICRFYYTYQDLFVHCVVQHICKDVSSCKWKGCLLTAHRTKVSLLRHVEVSHFVCMFTYEINSALANKTSCTIHICNAFPVSDLPGLHLIVSIKSNLQILNFCPEDPFLLFVSWETCLVRSLLYSSGQKSSYPVCVLYSLTFKRLQEKVN